MPQGRKGERTASRRPALPSLTLVAVLASAVVWCGCEADPDEVAPDDDTAAIEFDVQVEISTVVPTVARVHWTVDLDEVEEALVYYECAGDPTDLQRAEVDGGGYAVSLLGLKPSTDYRFRAAVTKDGTEFLSDEGSFTTGNVPASFPGNTSDLLSLDGHHDGLLLTSLICEDSMAVIYDSDGDPVWWHGPAKRGKSLILRAALSRDRRSVLYLVEADPEEGSDQPIRDLVKIALDGRAMEVVDVPGGHHDFLELADGTIAMLVTDTECFGEDCYQGDAIAEFSFGGETTLVWSAWDHLVFVPEEIEELDNGSRAWTHANALDFDDESNTYSVSLRNLDTLVSVDRSSSAVVEQVGGAHSDYLTPDGEGLLFEEQHQFQFLDDGVVVFDNGTPERASSRVVEYALDPQQFVAELVWSHEEDPVVFSVAMGDVTRLDNLNTLITWGGLGKVDEVTPAGEVVWSMSLGLGAAFGYTTYLGDL
jgi:hypothetical protein